MDTDRRDTPTTPSQLQISDAIDRLLANPQLLSDVARTLGVERGLSSDKKTEVNGKDHEKEKEAESLEAMQGASALPSRELAPVLSLLSGGIGKAPDSDLSRLLRALKPYVNQHRREAIDTVLDLSRITDVLKAVKQIDRASNTPT